VLQLLQVPADGVKNREMATPPKIFKWRQTEPALRDVEELL
jgi:hypothetical protein